jgi:hypothetical protein
VAAAGPSIVPAVKIWTERPAENDVEAVVRHYFDLVRAGKLPVAEKLVDHTSARHVLKALWSGSVGGVSPGARPEAISMSNSLTASR